MNKKGLLFYWIVFGALAAIALVVVFGFDTDLGTTAKGEWQNQFLDHYLEAEKVAAEQDVVVKQVAREIWTELAAERGFQDLKPCGTYNYLQLWSHEGECSLELADKIIPLLQSELEGQFDGSDRIVTGELEPIVIKTENLTYTQPFIFRLELGYILDTQ